MELNKAEFMSSDTLLNVSSKIKLEGKEKKPEEINRPERDDISVYMEKHEETRINPYSMTEEELIRRLSKPNLGNLKHQLMVAIVNCLTSMIFGQTLGWVYPELRSKNSSHVSNISKAQTPKQLIDAEQAMSKYIKLTYAVLASFLPLGCFIGTIIFNYLTNRNGPRKVIMITCPPIIIIWCLLTFVTTLHLVSVLLFLLALFTIGARQTGEYYMTDSVHMQYVKIFLIYSRSAIYFGIFLSFSTRAINNTTSILYSTYTSFQTLALFLLLLKCPESPVFLYDKNPKLAESSLIWFRGAGNFYIEMRQIKKDAEIRNLASSMKYYLFKKVIYRALIIVIILTIFESFSGFHLVIFYNQLNWPYLPQGFLFFNEQIEAVILGLTLFLSAVSMNFLWYKFTWGVRKPLILGFSCTFFIYICYITLVIVDYLIAFNLSWVRVFLTIGLIISFSFSFGACIDQLVRDYFPYQILPTVQGIYRSTRWLSLYVFVHIYLHTGREIYPHLALYFVIVCLISMFGLIFCVFFVIESKNLTLIELQLKIGGNPIGNRSAYQNLNNRARYEN